MKLIQGFLLLSLFPATLFAGQIGIGVIDGSSMADFERLSKPYLEAQLKNCDKCVLTNFSPYDSKGEFSKALLAEKITEASKTVQILFVNWNGASGADTKVAVEALNSAQDVLVVGFGGVAPANSITLPLNRTVLGQSSNVVLIGEMTKRQILAPGSHFGPEFLTAVKASDSAATTGLSIFPFVVQLAKQFNLREPASWREHFAKTKVSSRKLWPEVLDFFKKIN